jgi:hypothetical protein
VAQQQGACKAATNRTRSELSTVANVLIPIPSRSVAFLRNQWLSAKVRQSGTFERENEISVVVAPLYQRLQHEYVETS